MNRHYFQPVGDSSYCAYVEGVHDDEVCADIEQSSIHLSDGDDYINSAGGVKYPEPSSVSLPITPKELAELRRDDAEVRHLLDCLSEECAEVIKVCCKAKRFGLDDTYRADNGLDPPITPRQELRHELNDLSGTLALMQRMQILPPVDGHDDTERTNKDP